MSNTIGVGLIGAGWIGRVHAEQYLRVPQLCPLPGVTVKLRAVADVVPELAQSIATDFGFERCYADWQDLVADPEVTLVDICVPNVLHREIAVATAQAGKDIFCEKPMSMSPEEGRHMFETAEVAGVRHMINFNYRRAPAIAFAKQLLAQGVLGDIYHFRAGFCQDFAADPKAPWSWRFDLARAGGGSLVTMGTHVIDLARYLVGDIVQVMAMQSTFIRERPKRDGGVGSVSVDDSTFALMRFRADTVGILYTTWMAPGRKHHFEWEINGSKGSLFFNSERLNELQFCESDDPENRGGFKTIYMGQRHPYGDILGLKAGMGIGIRETFLLQVYELLRGVAEGSPVAPSFYDGWQVDRIVHAAAVSSTEDGWIAL